MADQIDNRAIPKILNPETHKYRFAEINEALFYMMYRIKESKMDDALIHLDERLTKWWNILWEEYDSNAAKQKVFDKLSDILDENFTAEELEVISEMSEFNLALNDPPF